MSNSKKSPTGSHILEMNRPEVSVGGSRGTASWLAEGMSISDWLMGKFN